MSGGQAAQLNGQAPRFMSDIAYKAMTYAIAVNEANAKMFRIVAVPYSWILWCYAWCGESSSGPLQAR